MNEVSPLRVVIDTNIVFEGLTRKGGAAGLIIDLWLADILSVFVSNALAYEYVDVLSRKLSSHRWRKTQPVLGELLSKANFVITYFSWHPSSPNPGDEHVIDCGMNAGATVITSNVNDFALAHETLGLPVMDLVSFINHLSE
jgi:predicted nucleic acid-binding protein